MQTGAYFAHTAQPQRVPRHSTPRTGTAPPYLAATGFCAAAELGCLAMRRLLPPQHVVGLLVAGLLCLMAAGVATMAKYGPKRGHTYAALQQDHR